MKIELKNVKYAKFASEETDCFEATVYIDGVKAGEVSNDGCGGPNTYHPRDLQLRLDTYGKTLPDKDAVLGGEKFTYPQSADTLISDFMDKWIGAKDLRRLLGSRLVWQDSDGSVYQTRKLESAKMADFSKMDVSALRGVLKLKDGSKILNRLPFDEALAIYIRGAS